MNNSQYGSEGKVWGLYHKDARTAIPLKSLHASISIVNAISHVKYTQHYYNGSDDVIETEFFFPISSDACFDSFEAKFNDTTIRGVIKKKQQAQEEYKEAIAQGRTAAYSEINEETGDIMKIMIGNIPPQTTVGITYSYIQKLEVAANRFLCFRLFSTITPRYNGNLQNALKADIALLSNYPTISSQDPQAYPWRIEAEIQSASSISFVKSPSHDITPVYGNENHTCKVTFKSNEPQYPNKDFLLLYTNENKQDKIDYMLTPFEEGYCAMVNVRADFQTASDEKVYENLVKAKEIESEYSMDEVKGEFIFLIDRSGSMSGERIIMARDSLALFLKSLPQDSLFNVVSFGSSFKFLYGQGSSQKYNQHSLEESVKQVERFEADFGGTEIYQALQKVLHEPVKTGYPRSVFLLTDGGVSNTSSVLNLIKENSHKTRVFTIGIGNGCSQELITQGAVCGRGTHEFVANNSEVYEKVISLLNASLSPCYSDITLESSNFDAVVKALTPNPSSISSLLDGQMITFFLFLRAEAFANDQKMTLKLNMNDSRSQQKRCSIDILLDTNESMQNELIPKLAVHDMIRRLETEKTNIVWMSKEDIRESLVELSLKHGVLCKETAFFCETEKSNVKTIQDAQKIKIVIPTTLSQDYAPPGNNAYRCMPSFSSTSRSKQVHRNGSEIQDIMMKNIDFAMERGEVLENLSKQSGQLTSTSKSFKKSSQTSSGGFFGGITNAFSSMFSSKSTAPKAENKRVAEICPPKPYIPQASYQQQQQQSQPPASISKSDVSNFDCAFAEEDKRKICDDGLQSAPREYAGFSYEPEDPCNTANILPSSVSKQQSATANPSGSYLQVVKKQKFEGFWDPQDSSIHQAILKNYNSMLPQVPEQIKSIDASLAQTIWVTLLVLLWLEVSCQSERKAWSLIYQKGVNWLKRVGVNYEDTKSLGVSEVKA